MRANPYDWIKQGSEHRMYARRHYPMLAGLAGNANGYPAFAMSVQALPAAAQTRYSREWQKWYQRHGRSWEKLGCIKENRLGQYTDRYRWTEWRPGLGRLGSFDTSVYTGPAPAPLSGFHKCTSMVPGGHSLVSGPHETGTSGWRYNRVMGLQGGAAGVEFFEVFTTDPNDHQKFYWLPIGLSCSGQLSAGAESPKKTKIIALQKALSAQGYVLKADGVFGPKTCGAAYDYQRTIVGVSSPQLTGDLFVSLGLPSAYATALGNGCSSWYSAAPAPYTPPAPSPGPTPGPAPEIEKEKPVEQAGFSKWLLPIGALLLVGGLFAASKRKGKKGRKKKGAKRSKRR